MRSDMRRVVGVVLAGVALFTPACTGNKPAPAPPSVPTSSTPAPATSGHGCRPDGIAFRAVFSSLETAPTANPGLPQTPPAAHPATPTTDPSTPGLLNTLLAWTPGAADQRDFDAWTCSQPFPDVWDAPLFACDAARTTKYLLGPALIRGDRLQSAAVDQQQGQTGATVDLALDDTGAADFDTVTRHLYGTPSSQLALVVGGVVMSAPAVVDAGGTPTHHVFIAFPDQASAERVAGACTP